MNGQNSQTDIDKQFIYWQCQIRKHAMRNAQGRPSTGMRPELIVDDESLGFITTLLVPSSPEIDTSHFQHLYQKTFDPKIRREGALKYLQSEFYQMPGAFNGELCALAAKHSTWADKVVNAKNRQLVFNQESRQWQFHCEVQRLLNDDSRWQFSLAHNRMFNSSLTTQVEVLLFKPIWEESN